MHPGKRQSVVIFSNIFTQKYFNHACSRPMFKFTLFNLLIYLLKQPPQCKFEKNETKFATVLINADERQMINIETENEKSKFGFVYYLCSVFVTITYNHHLDVKIVLFLFCFHRQQQILRFFLPAISFYRRLIFLREVSIHISLQLEKSLPVVTEYRQSYANS